MKDRNTFIKVSLHGFSARIFSLHMPLASRTFISCVCRPSDKADICLELKTTDSAQCTHTGSEEMQSECSFMSCITVTYTHSESRRTFLFCDLCVCVSVSNVIPVELDEDHELVKQFTRSCGEQKASGWITR